MSVAKLVIEGEYVYCDDKAAFDGHVHIDDRCLCDQISDTLRDGPIKRVRITVEVLEE